MAAAADSFTIEITGRGGRGATASALRPDGGGGQSDSAAQTIVSRNVSPLETAVMGISAVEGGNLPASNVVPDKSSSPARYAPTTRRCRISSRLASAKW